MHYTVLHYTLLYCHCTVLYFTVLHNVLYCAALYCRLHCTVTYCSDTVLIFILSTPPPLPLYFSSSLLLFFSSPLPLYSSTTSSLLLFFSSFSAIIETLEADVRSKFQTKRRIEDCQRGVVVEVPFDVTTVSFLWRQERVLEVTDISLFKP